MGSQQAVQMGKRQAWRHMGKGRHADAVAILLKVLKSAQKDPEVWYLLGCSHASLGQWSEAIGALESSIRLYPRAPQSHFALAGAWIGQGRLEQAIDSLHTTLGLAENMTDAHVALANLLITQGNVEDARAHLERALQLDPKLSDAHIGLGAIEEERSHYQEALRHFEQALKYNSRNLKALCAMATCLANLARKSEAKTYYRKALRIEPNCAEARGGLAMIYAFNGQHDKAMQLITPSLEKKLCHSMLALAYAQTCKHYDRCEEALEVVRQALEQPGLARPTIKSLHFAAGRLLDGMGKYDAAFKHFKAGNEAMRSFYDSVAHAQTIHELVETFTPDLFMKIPPARNDDRRPIFILGMPRSGTSLTEQILAAHPQVHAAGELDALPNVAQRIRLELGFAEVFPNYLSNLTQENIDAMADYYLARLYGLSKQAARITDKMPHNFYLVGLIQLLFPCARIIHCRRDPLDTCLSIYFQDFHEQHTYAKNLFSIGTHYNQYQRLMDHWKQVTSIPMFDLCYEDLVRDQEATTRRLLDFCELEWDERCLQFYSVQRIVDTASNEQVRQPIYRKSVARWRHYEHHLADLKEGLERGF